MQGNAQVVAGSHNVEVLAKNIPRSQHNAVQAPTKKGGLAEVGTSYQISCGEHRGLTHY